MKAYSQNTPGGSAVDNSAMVSVIVPAFNPDIDSLRECIRSILDQRLRDIELIIVDDGSDLPIENSLGRGAGLDSRCKVIRQMNLGVSAARNTGMQVATGNYLLFVDADDVLSPDSLDVICGIAERFSADVTVGVILVRHSDRTLAWRERPPEPRVLTSEQVADARRAALVDQPSTRSANGGPVSTNVLGMMYRRSAVGTLRFPVGVAHGEDRIFNFEFLSSNPTFVATATEFYIYDQRDKNSATRSIGPSSALSLARTVAALARLSRGDDSLSSTTHPTGWEESADDRAVNASVFAYLKTLCGAVARFRRFDAGQATVAAILQEPEVCHTLSRVIVSSLPDRLFLTLARRGSTPGVLLLGRLWNARTFLRRLRGH